MKKNYFKKSLSLLMTVLMIMSCWVFFPGMIPEAEAASNVTTYGIPAINGAAYTPSDGTNAYDTPIFDGTRDRWFLWQNGDDYTKVYYPSHIYLDVTESLEAAGYNWEIEWHFGDSTDYRTFLGANIWGDHSNWSGLPSNYYVMNNIFSNYAVDVSVPQGTDSNGGVYGRTSSSTNFDVRVVGYSYCSSEQGTDQFTYNQTTHSKYVLLRTRQITNKTYLYLKGNPSSSYKGTTSSYSTQGHSFQGYGYAQKYGSSWSTHDGGSNVYYYKGDDSSYSAVYTDGVTYNEMAWNITIYDKSALNTLINTAISMRDDTTQYSRVARAKLASAITTAQAVLTKRATTQTEIDSAKSTLQAVVDAAEKRTYELTYENLFSVSDWWNSNSGYKTGVSVDLSAGKVTVQNVNASGEYVTPHSGSGSTAGTRNTNYYCMPVTGGNRYTIKYTTDHANTQMFAFFYNEDGGCVHESSFGAYNFTVSNGTGQATFTAPTEADYMEIRFDNNNPQTTANFWDIMIYDADRAAEIDLEDWLVRPHRVLYTYGDTLTSSKIPTPQRKGYSFDYWYLPTYSDAKVSDFYNNYTFAASWPVYSSWTQLTLDIGYDNLFSLSGWAQSSTSTTMHNGTATYDVAAGTITVTQTSSDPTYSYSSHSGDGLYVMKFDPIDEARTFVITYDYKLDSGTASPYVLVFDTNSTYNGFDSNTEINNGYGTFTVPAGCDAIHLRFGVKGATVGATMTLSDIAVYEQEAYEYAKNYAKVREPFKYGDTTNLLANPTREGYRFDGWYTADGNKLTSVDGLYESDTVYAQWVKTYTVTFQNASGATMHTVTVDTGTVLDESTHYPLADPDKSSDTTYSYTFTKWDYDGSAVTDDLTVKPVFTSKAHGNYTYTLVTAAKCESNAIVKKVCGNCKYSFGNVTFDGDASVYPQYIATGHDFTDQPAVSGSSNGSQHQVCCKRYTTESCGGTTYVDHTWTFVETTGATCSVKGTNHYKCTCGATKTEEGVLAPSVHENTKEVNYVAATCLVEGKEYDTYCNDCNQTIETGAVIPALGHNWTNTKTNLKSEATCTADAVYWQECSRCKISAENDTTSTGTTWTDTGSVLGHDWTETEKYLKSAADCENDAVYYMECSRCTVSSENEDGSTWTKADTAWGHSFDGAYVSNNNGTHTQKCTNTGCTATGNEQTCTYGDWDTTAADTHSKTCQHCSYVYIENHDWSAWTSTDRTKAEAGTMTRYCTTCRKEVTDDCNYTVTADVKETCTTAAYKTYTCSDCGHGYTVIGNAATGHDYTGEYKYNSTSDVHIQLCKNGCGKYGSVVDGVQTDNKWVDCSWTYTNKADGTHTASCVCGNTQDEACTGGEATCTKPAVCEKCNTGYGATAPHTFEGTAVALDGDVHAYRCKYCNDQTIYGVGENQGYTEGCSGGTATCTDKAVCTVCGDTHGELDADNHKWINATNVSGTETHTYTCEYDSTHIKTENCYSSMPAVAAPDCNTAGYTLNTCDYCNHTWQTNPTDALGHDWSAWVNNEDGTHTRTCERGCGYDDNEEKVNCTKDNATSVVTAPTCLDQGYTTYTCKDCGYVWVDDYVNATGHSYNNKTKNATATYLRSEQTCTTALTYWYKCDNCAVSAVTEKDKYDNESALYWVSKEAKSHSFTEKNTDEKYLASEATCTEKAVYYYSCANCGASSEDIDGTTFTSGTALGHDWIDTEKYKKSDADCVDNEVYYKECSRCDASSETVTGDTWTKADTLKGHDFDHDDDGAIGNEGDTGYVAYKAATCAEEGVLEHYTCETCGKMFSDKAATTEIYKTAIAALGHNMANVARKAATCEEDGYTAHKACSRCGQRNSDYSVISAKGHDFSGAYYCDSVNNYHAKYCVNTDCTAYGLNGIKYTVEYNENDEAVITGGEECVFDEFTTSTVDGVHSHNVECDCGNASVVVIGSDDISTETVAATCTADGYTLNTCTKDDCGESWKTDITEKLGHDLTGTATSNGNGTHSVKCSREDCGYSADADKCSTATPSTSCGERNTCDTCLGVFGDEIEHVFTNYVYNNDATCESDGTKTAECDNCHTGATETVTATGTKLGHDYTDYIYDVSGWTNNMPEDFDASTIKEPTCGEEGLSISYCTRCDSYKTKPVAKDKNAHNMPEEWTLVGGDCSTGVTYVRECTICGDKEAKTEKVPHDWKAIAIVQAGCTTNGFIEFECTACGFTETLDETTAGFPVFEGVDYTDKNIVAKGAHTWQTEAPADADYMMIDGVVVFVEKYPAYNATGRGYKKCTLCSTTEKVVIDAYGNNPEDHKHPELGINDNSTLKYVAEVEPTCTVGGHKGYWECTRCSYSEYVIDHDAFYIAPYGHTQANSKGKCDRCQTVLEENDASENCGCICHKTGFMKFIYSILKFFWKIFGMNKTCDCGAVHY